MTLIPQATLTEIRTFIANGACTLKHKFGAWFEDGEVKAYFPELAIQVRQFRRRCERCGKEQIKRKT